MNPERKNNNKTVERPRQECESRGELVFFSLFFWRKILGKNEKAVLTIYVRFLLCYSLLFFLFVRSHSFSSRTPWRARKWEWKGVRNISDGRNCLGVVYIPLFFSIVKKSKWVFNVHDIRGILISSWYFSIVKFFFSLYLSRLIVFSTGDHHVGCFSTDE